ncbi:MAG: macro domain-containing protein [Treponemataceae bacterium]|nr:macro domain-containing protein [Treponemataceae bacterium]
MISYTTGDILTSSADCLVNTVNCEGFMGKGIAYQFKLAYPENEKEYVKQCKSGKFHVGTVTFYRENGKTIINFPTKDKWRNKSEYSYIETGLADLVKKLPSQNVKSIAIPPLGCGNGGLAWVTVKEMIENAIKPLENQFDFIVYEPSMYYKNVPKKEPQMSASDLLLLNIKVQTAGVRFTKLRLQKTAYFMDMFAGTDYFKFGKNKNGPYSHVIEVCSKRIREFQSYYNTSNVDTYELLKNKLISESVNKVIETYKFPILRATQFSNSINNEGTLEIVSTLIAVVKERESSAYEEIEKAFYAWSDEKLKYSKEIVKKVFDRLVELHFFNKELIGFSFNKQITEQKTMLKF